MTSNSTPTPADATTAADATTTTAPNEPMGPAECAQQLKQRFPALFGGSPKPLKLRIQADIQARAPGVFPKQALSAFLRRYTGSTSYLIHLTKASHRVDLDGQNGDEISEEHREAARQELARRRAITQARREEEEKGRRERFHLLRDFEKTTLTEANFCALKGFTPEQLQETLALARKEATELPPLDHRHPHDGRTGPRGGDRRDGSGGREGRGGPREGRGRGGPDGRRDGGQARRDGGRPQGRPDGRRDGRPQEARGPRGGDPARQRPEAHQNAATAASSTVPAAEPTVATPSATPDNAA